MSERRQRGSSNDPEEGPGARTPGPEGSPPAEEEEEKDGRREPEEVPLRGTS